MEKLVSKFEELTDHARVLSEWSQLLRWVEHDLTPKEQFHFLCKLSQRPHEAITVDDIREYRLCKQRPRLETGKRGAWVLFNAAQELAFDSLPRRFGFMDMKRALGKSHSSAANLIKKCLARGLVLKTEDGYEKI
ncbi:hypothetical protein MYX84_15455 [Acidobacteria bacterium AH-259-O06]|nr:hypothetical protein [Acidobacteria bacterium AH-259-O06]